MVLFGDEDFIVAFTTHHVAWDGVSKAVFFRELGVLYDAIASGQRPILPEPAIQYADYAFGTLWDSLQREHKQMDKMLSVSVQQGRVDLVTKGMNAAR